MAFLNNRGAMFYTLVGVMVIILVLAVALHIMRSSYRPDAADEIRLARFNSAVYGLQAEIESLARDAEYPVIWKAGHNVTEEGVNAYLVMPNGRNQLRKDLVTGYTENINERLRSLSESNDPKHYDISSDGIAFTLDPVRESDVNLTETGEGLNISMKLHMTAGNGNYRYDHNPTITSEVPARIFQMYDRAKAFHEGFGRVQDYATALLYIRGYANAYLYSHDGLCGPYYKVGHISYDPLHTFLSGDLKALNNTKLPQDLTDVGAIPTAIWLAEWHHLGEPNFMPVGIDLSTEKKQTFGDAFKASSSNADYEEKILQLKELKQQLEKMKAEIDNYEQKIDARISHQSDYQEEECCDFKEDTKPLLDEITTWIGSGAMDSQYIISRGEQNTVDVTDAKKGITDWNVIKNTLTTYSSKLDYICDQNCPGTGDCDCPDADEGCDEAECDKVHCGSGDHYFKCIPREVGHRHEDVDCKDEEGNEFTDSVTIHECDCRCHPNPVFVQDIDDELYKVLAKLRKMKGDISAVENNVDNILNTDSKLQDFQNKADNLESVSGLGFDVVGNLKYNSVKYGFATNNWCNYPNPTKAVKDEGVCAAWDESFTLYGAQITAAATAAYLTGGALTSTIKYAVDFFPAVYDYNANYTISETIVDDKNRIMLHNLFAGDDDLYGYNVTPKLFTHVAPEFVIYRNRTITASSSTLGRIFLFLYLPDLGGFVAIQKGVASNQCKGIKSDNSQCIYDYQCS